MMNEKMTKTKSNPVRVNQSNELEKVTLKKVSIVDTA